jgi:uncharacterized membrane protein YfhO
VPAGNTRIVCRYVPPGFKTGLLLSLGSGLVFVAWLLASWLGLVRRDKNQT